MKGMRYIGGRRAGRVADMESAFLADVRAAVAEGAAVYVEVGMGVSESFEANVAALGVPIQRLSTLGARAMLYEIIDDGEGT